MNKDKTGENKPKPVIHSPPIALRSGTIRGQKESKQSIETIKMQSQTECPNSSENSSNDNDRIEQLENRVEKLIEELGRVKLKHSASESRDSQDSDDDTYNPFRETRQQFRIKPEGIRLPRGGWIKNPFDEVRFTGKSDDGNPMRFLKKFDNIAKYETVDRSDQLYFFGRCMREQASAWFEIHNFDNMEEARNEFTRYFWGDTQQAKFREKLYTGRYKPSKNLRMADYALDIARKAKTLEPPMGDAEIIRCLKRHFDREITREIKITTVKTIADLMFLLEEIHDEREISAEIRAREKNVSKENATGNKNQSANNPPTSNMERKKISRIR